MLHLKKMSGRRMLSILSIVSAAALALSACSSTSTSDSKESGDITLNALFQKQAGYSVSDINSMIAGFEKANPNIKVKPTYVAYEALHDKIVTSAPAGTYDLALGDTIWAAEFATKGIAVDVTDRFKPAWQQEMSPLAFSTFLYKGKHYGMPWFPGTKMFYYNTNMLKKVGAKPSDLETWDGVLNTSKKIKSAGLSKYPIAWSWGQAEALICDYTQLVGAFGGALQDSQGNWTVNKGAGVQALTWMRKTITDGLTNPASTTFLEDDVAKSMQQGKTAFSLNWEATFSQLNDKASSQIAGKAAVIPTPEGPSGKRPGVNGSQPLVLMPKSKHKDAAWKLITYLSSQSVENQFAQSTLPIWKSSLTDPEVVKTNPQVVKTAVTSYADSIDRPQVSNYNGVSQLLQVQLQKALLGKESPQQALDEFVAQAKNE